VKFCLSVFFIHFGKELGAGNVHEDVLSENVETSALKATLYVGV